jgi:hypothetical protein
MGVYIKKPSSGFWATSLINIYEMALTRCIHAVVPGAFEALVLGSILMSVDLNAA